MWVFTKTGFISIVEYRGDPSSVLVRARRREDIERMFGPVEIEENLSADYRWRSKIPRSVVAAAVAAAVVDIDYVSHAKEEMVKVDEGRRREERYNAYLNVWSAMYQFQKEETHD